MQLLRNPQDLFARVGIETVVGAGSWFTQSIRSGNFKPRAFGQVEQSGPHARINWLLACYQGDDNLLPRLIDNLSFEAGLHGAKFLTAAMDLDSALFQTFRKAGFCVFGWERFWKLDMPASLHFSEFAGLWEKPVSMDAHEVHKFRMKHLPPAVRSISASDWQDLPDYIIMEDHSIAAYADVKLFGSKAILFPVLDEGLKDRQAVLLALAATLPEYVSTAYVAQTGSLGWLESALADIACPATERKEQLVKYFSVAEKAPLGLLNHSREGSHPDPVSPYVHSSKL